MRILVLFVVGFLSYQVSADDLADKWEFRGYQANKRMIETLEGTKKLTDAEACTMGLESAYALHIDPKTKDIVGKTAPSGARVKSMTFRSGENWTQVGFVYEKGKKEPMGWKALRIADGHEVLSIRSSPENFSVATEKCMYVFSLSDPFSALAIPHK